MPNLDLPILAVDDAKFSSTIIGRTLKLAGYRDIRIANSAGDALRMLEQRPVSVLIADWLMPEMDGLELAAKVRQLDEAQNHFTYVILLTAKESPEALREAFDRGVDDFIYKSEMNRQLLPRIYAADRISDMQNSLLMANQLLMDSNREYQTKNVIDLVTGVGNQTFARIKLQDHLRQTEARGGACSYLLLGLKNWEQLQQQYNRSILDEIATGIARRLRNLTRPLDTVCRVAENQFAIISQFSHIDHCSPACYRRIHDGINLKAFKTSAGFVSVQAGTSVCATGHTSELPTVQQMEKAAGQYLQYAYETGTISVKHWPEIAREFQVSAS